MSQNMSQNIFNYATSELSQDAFLSLLVAWFDSGDSKLEQISKDFINSLYNEYFKSDIVLDIESIKLIQQHFKIDVYFEITEKNGNVIPFIIEDKTWTESHSGQLKRYVDKVASKNIDKDKIVKIFFKTGHITEKDKFDTQNIYYSNNPQQDKYYKNVPYYYKILDVQWMWNFISKYQVDNVIFNQYVDFIQKEFYSKMYDIKTHTKKELKDWKYGDAREGYVQYQIIEYIKFTVLKTGDVVNKNKIGYVRNGKAWNTWWTFYDEPEQYGIFFKVVHLNGARRIRLVEYSYINTTPEQKQKSLAENINICRKILENDNYANIACGNEKKYQVNSGKNKGKIVRESEIANLNLKNELTLLKNSQIFSKFLEEFIDKKARRED
ncbi:MAG: PD-(D/E)XK nuclease family protein [Bacteroidales bacterium]|nr:PD-(D/E)XK nuclease family protein [Bacteroidales bacterium]